MIVRSERPITSWNSGRRPQPSTPHSSHCCAEQRSEEHTSELQSPCNLVCRLLLEKKKKRQLTHLLMQRGHPSRRPERLRPVPKLCPHLAHKHHLSIPAPYVHLQPPPRLCEIALT